MVSDQRMKTIFVMSKTRQISSDEWTWEENGTQTSAAKLLRDFLCATARCVGRVLYIRYRIDFLLLIHPT